MALHLRAIERSDVAEILRMIKSLALHEGRPDDVTITEDRLCEIFFEPDAVIKAFLIINKDKTIGYSIVEDKISSFTGDRILYVEDVFIDSVFRGAGLGTDVMKKLALYAAKHKYDSMAWSALAGNLSAIGFYDNMKATREADRVHFSFTSEQITAFAEGV